MNHFRNAAMASAMFLTACANLVITERPLFSVADAAGAPKFRPGIWDTSSHQPPADCTYDGSKPETTWPACASPPAPIGETPSWLAVSGDPAIMQFPGALKSNSGKGAFSYMAFRVVKSDADGRATGAEVWPVLCGPPPAKADESGLTRYLSSGLKPSKDSNNCTTNSQTAVRRAARASRAWASDTAAIHWVRDAIPGDLPPETDP